MFRNVAGQIILATAIFCTACAGGSKSTKATPVATAVTPEAQPPATEPYAKAEGQPVTPETALPPEAMPSPGAPGTSGERQPVSGRDDTGMMPKTTEGTGTVAPTESGPAALGQSNIFALLTAASQSEIDMAKLALQKSKNKEVKKLAQTIVNDHQKLIADGEKTAQKMSVTPMDNDDVKAMRSDASGTMERLKGLEGKEFDRAFVDQMVTDHNKVIDLIDSKIAPVATGTSDLSNMLDNARAKVSAHLVAAKTLKDKLDR